MLAKLEGVEKLNRNTYTFGFKPSKPLRYLPGQFIQISLPGSKPDNRGDKRWFTLSSSPTEELLCITTKYFDKNSSTFKQSLISLAIGSEVHISEPMGDFVLPKDNHIPIVFVVGGVGVTPLRSIIKYLTDTNQKRKIIVFYTVQDKADLIFLDVLKKFILKPNILVTNHSRKHLDAETILENSFKTNNQLFYVSGPETMTEKLESELLAVGVSSDQLILDFFPGYSEI